MIQFVAPVLSAALDWFTISFKGRIKVMVTEGMVVAPRLDGGVTGLRCIGVSSISQAKNGWKKKGEGDKLSRQRG